MPMGIEEQKVLDSQFEMAMKARRLCGCMACYGGYPIGHRTLQVNGFGQMEQRPTSCLAWVFLEKLIDGRITLRHGKDELCTCPSDKDSVEDGESYLCSFCQRKERAKYIEGLEALAEAAIALDDAVDAYDDNFDLWTKLADARANLGR
jgi:hypothetical protein